jgi:hypothetical protein
MPSPLAVDLLEDTLPPEPMPLGQRHLELALRRRA